MSLSCRQAQLSLTPHFHLGPLNYDFSDHAITAIVGPNGAGKSSFFRLITGLEEPTKGEITFQKERIYPENHLYKRRIGYLPQPLELPLWVSAQDVLHYIAQLKQIPAPQESIKKLMDLWQIHSYCHQPLVACSYGMKKRVALALALLGTPELLILDEPLSGLDVLHIACLRSILKERQAAKLPTLISTHILSFACEEATDILLMKQGQWHTVDSWNELGHIERRKYLKNFFNTATDDEPLITTSL